MARVAIFETKYELVECNFYFHCDSSKLNEIKK